MGLFFLGMLAGGVVVALIAGGLFFWWANKIMDGF